MPYLKNKVNSARQNNSSISRANAQKLQILDQTQPTSLKTKVEARKEPSKKDSKKSSQTVSKTKRDQSKPSSKNIVKNFGKAMCSFASSELSLPYLNRINVNWDVNLENFQEYIQKKRDLIDSIDSLRSLLLIMKNDDEVIVGYKKIFQEISIIFIKYFSVNWIFQGKMSHKQAHLKARFKMLRRIKSPQHFTYFKDFSR